MTDAWGTVISALIAVIVGGLVGLRTGRRQVQDAAQVEHEQWLRGQRQEAYSTFLTEWDNAYASLKRKVARTTKEWEEMDQRHMDLFSFDADDFEHVETYAEQAMQPVRAAQERVLLLGPDTVDQAVERMGTALDTLGEAFFHHLTPGPKPQLTVQWEDAIDTMEKARTHMLHTMRTQIRTPLRVGRATRRLLRRWT